MNKYEKLRRGLVAAFDCGDARACFAIRRKLIKEEVRRVKLRERFDMIEPEPSKIIYKFEVGWRARAQMTEEQTPGAYRVVKANTPSGIIVHGRYGDEWRANPGTRELIAHLLRAVRELKLKEGG